MYNMIRRFASLATLAGGLAISGCALIPGVPESAVGDDQVAFAVRAFLDSSAALARAYSYGGVYVDDVTASATRNRIVGMGNKRGYVLSGYECDLRKRADCLRYGVAGTAAQEATRLYVKNGWQLSQLLCRNYLAGLSEKNSAFNAIKKELNIAGGLAQLTMAAARASARSIAYVGAIDSFIQASLENFGDFEYLTPDQSTLQDLVYKSQQALGRYYTIAPNIPDTLVGAINAVHRIDSLCTRSGLRHMINRSLNNIGIEAESDGTLSISGVGDLARREAEFDAKAIIDAEVRLNALEATKKGLSDSLRVESDPTVRAALQEEYENTQVDIGKARVALIQLRAKYVTVTPTVIVERPLPKPKP